MLKYTHLTLEERVLISYWLEERKSISFIARGLGRSKSTISQEIRRNRKAAGRS